MEQISSTLYPYRNILGILANSCSFLQHLSGIVLCYDICKSKTSSGVSSYVFFGNLVLALLGLKFAAITDDNLTFYLYFACIIMQSSYILVCWYYSQNRNSEIYVPLLYSGLIVGSAYGYAAYEDLDRLRFRFGAIFTLMVIAELAFPLQNLKAIIQKEDASSIPFPVMLMSSVVSVMWFLYGLAIRNGFLVTQCAVCFVICGVQLILYIKYPKKHEE